MEQNQVMKETQRMRQKSWQCRTEDRKVVPKKRLPSDNESVHSTLVETPVARWSLADTHWTST